MGTVKFNNVSTEDLGLIVQTIPTYDYPQKDYEVTHIAGKSGDIVIDKGSYQNVTRTYYLASVFKEGTNFIQNANKITDWLNSASGYARLEDSYEPDYYRLAMYNTNGSMPNLYDTATSIQVDFTCKPQRFLKSGEKEIDLNSSDTITNPTGFASKPIFIFNGTGIKVTLTNGTYSCSFSISDTKGNDVKLDSYIQECYSGDSLYNSSVELTNGFPELKKGTTTVTIEYTTLTKMQVVPNWWTL